MNDGWYVLGMCILSPEFVIPEIAFAHYYAGVPLTAKGSKKLQRTTWFNEDMRQEWLSMSKILGSCHKASIFYNINYSEFNRMSRNLKNDGTPLLQGVSQ